MNVYLFKKQKKNLFIMHMHMYIESSLNTLCHQEIITCYMHIFENDSSGLTKNAFINLKRLR